MLTHLSGTNRYRRCHTSRKSLPLLPPPPALKIVENNFVSPTSGDDLPVAATKWTISPPPVLDKPRFAYRVDLAAVNRERATVFRRFDRDTARDR